MAAVAKGKTNWFAIGISIAVVVVLVGLGALVVSLNNQASAPGAIPQGAQVNEDTGAIVLSEGSETLSVYFDFMCPHCADFEGNFGEQLSELSAEDKMGYELLPVAIMDRTTTTEFSTRSANAAYCVADDTPAAVVPFVTSVFEKQNAEGLTDEQLVQAAKDAGAGDVSSCIADRTYEKLVKFTTQNLPENEQGQQATPALTWNGEYLPQQELPAELAKLG